MRVDSHYQVAQGKGERVIGNPFAKIVVFVLYQEADGHGYIAKRKEMKRRRRTGSSGGIIVRMLLL